MIQSVTTRTAPIPVPETLPWTPMSWASCVQRQQPDWPDPSQVRRVLNRLLQLPPLVCAADVHRLKQEMARAAEGKAFVLQGGDCSENFKNNTPDKIFGLCTTLSRMAATLATGLTRPVVAVGRLAGQFAKPRSSNTQTVNGIIFPSYRGDLVNDAALSLKARTPDPGRLLEGYAMAQKTHGLLAACGTQIFTSHEALLLPYEAGLVRKHPEGRGWYAGSGHMLWIGERTRQPDSAQVELLRGVSNPIGIKVGPQHHPQDICRLCNILNPENEAGRISLIIRFGHNRIESLLPPLIQSIRNAGHQVVWMSDPMHGNTVTASSGVKTRNFDHIADELQHFFQIHSDENSVPGGIHLEMTGENVTECLGGSSMIRDEDLKKRYWTSCDPRLNADQSLEIAAKVSCMPGLSFGT